jgi:predicted RNA-binding protein associated with RNAse of E/G family
MKARGTIAGGAYGPDQLKALGKAFDDAWARIAPTVSSRAKAIEASRLKLAEVILSLAKQGNFDPQWLADTAVQLVVARSSRSQP